MLVLPGLAIIFSIQAAYNKTIMTRLLKAFETKYKGLARVLLFSLVKETATSED
jgi:hypothetical protein